MIKQMIVLLILCMGIGLSAKQTDSPIALKKIKISLIWNFQSEFSGAIIAKELGFFAEAGYDVELIGANLNVNAITELQKGKTDYTITWFSIAVESNANSDTKMKLISQIVRQSNSTIMAWREFNGKKIEKIQDLNGLETTIHRFPLSIPYTLLFEKENVTPKIIPQYATPTLFYKKGAAACTVLKYQGNELFRLYGVRDEDLILFQLRDFGMNIPEDGLYTLTTNHNEKEQRAIAKAIEKGWLYAKNNPKETAKVVVKYALMGNSKYPNETFMLNNLNCILPSVFIDSEPIQNYGHIDRKTYEHFSKELLKYNELKDILPYEEFVTPKARSDG